MPKGEDFTLLHRVLARCLEYHVAAASATNRVHIPGCGIFVENRAPGLAYAQQKTATQ